MVISPNINNKTLKIVQWNCRSINSNRASFHKFIYENDIDIAILSETWLKPTANLNIPGFSIIRKDRLDGKAGVAILVSNKIEFVIKQLVDNFNDDILVCAVTLNGQYKLDILSVYRAPHITASHNDWKKIFSQVSSSLLVGGDFNAHNNMWGSSKNDNHGNALFRAIDECNLVVLNNGDVTHLVNPTSNMRSVVDITMVSPNVAVLANWEVCEDTLGSDHYSIKIELANFKNPTDLIFPSTRWSFKNANWELYYFHLSEYFRYCPLDISTPDMYNFFIRGVSDAADKSFAINRPFLPKNKKCPVWWDNECTQAITRRELALRNFKTEPSQENYLKCKSEFASVKLLLKSKARSSWKAYCNNLNKNNNISDVWQQIKLMNGLRNKNGGKKHMTNDTAQIFFDLLAPDMVHLETPPVLNDNGNHPLNTPFTLHELDKALKNTVNTAPGDDSINYPMIINMPLSAKRIF